MSQEKTQKFRFAYRRMPGTSSEVERDGFIHLDLTQQQFEDYQYLQSQVVAALQRLHVHPSIWHQSPEVPAHLEDALREALGLDPGCLFSHYYAHSGLDRHYALVKVNGLEYRWKAFNSGYIIKVRPEMAEQPAAAAA